jgi:hypothetical protein
MTSTETDLEIGRLNPLDDRAAATGHTRSWMGLNRLAAAFSIYAALRIFLLASVFPLFNNVDERLHLMSIQMYAQGQWPGKELPRMDPQLVRRYLAYWSPEYGRSASDLKENRLEVPVYRLSDQERQRAYTGPIYAEKLEDWLQKPNFEAQGPPLYYVVAAAWYRLGAAAGLTDWRLLYWTRCLNAIIYGLFVWLSYNVVRKIYPAKTFLCVAVPGLIAVFPQDVFFGMNRDVLSPLVCAAALFSMADALADRKYRVVPLLLASLLTGLSFLVEVSNFVMFGALAATLWIWARRPEALRRQRVWVSAASAAAALFLPALWMVRNYLVIGDLTGGTAKVRELGWTVKPVGEMLHHPLFSWHGLYYFCVQLTERFWRGEYGWHGLALRSASADGFYVLSSALMMVIFVVDLWRTRKTLSAPHSWVKWQALFLVIGSVLFLAAVSLVFDYHNHGYPSRLYPYFVSGRIIIGVLLPFVLIYASGLELILERFSKWVPPMWVLAGVMFFITASEIRVRSVVFSSPYSYFALSSWKR